MRRVAETLRTVMGERRINIVIAMMKDKEIGSALSFLQGLDVTLYCTEVPGCGRSLGAEEMAEKAVHAGFQD